MSAPKLRVLISGAGIAGSCLAYWLAQTPLRISTTIIERSPSPRFTGQSVDIRGPAVKIIKRMKLEEAVRSRYTTEEGTRFVNPLGKSFARFNAGDSFTAEYEILRADLSQLFLEATEGLGKIKYQYGDSVKYLEQTDKDINVTFTGASKDTFDLVVAADGSISETRSMILDKGTEHAKRMLHRQNGIAGWQAKRVLEGMDNAVDFYMSRAAQVKLSKRTNGRALVLRDAAFATFVVGTSLAIESAYV